jgi:GxxExxY protein
LSHHRAAEDKRNKWDSLNMKDYDELSGKVIGCAIEVHRNLGPGLLESAYEKSLSFELSANNIHHCVQKALPVKYKHIDLDCEYRIDLLIENKLIVELKAIEKILPIHEAQLLTYMRLANMKTGLLINFNVPLLKQGIKRFVL